MAGNDAMEDTFIALVKGEAVGEIDDAQRK